MKDKRWLIRTVDHEILGPISLEKLLSILDEGKLSEEDELCDRDGEWFYIREKDYLNKLVFGRQGDRRQVQVTPKYNLNDTPKTEINIQNPLVPHQAPRVPIKKVKLKIPENKAQGFFTKKLLYLLITIFLGIIVLGFINRVEIIQSIL